MITSQLRGTRRTCSALQLVTGIRLRLFYVFFGAQYENSDSSKRQIRRFSEIMADRISETRG